MKVTTRLGGISNINFEVTRSVNDFPVLSVVGSDVQYLPVSEETSLKAVSSYVPCALINATTVNLICLFLSHLSIFLSIYGSNSVSFSVPIQISPLVYRWELDPSTVNLLALDPITSNTSSLYIPPGSLKYGEEYNLRVISYPPGEPDKNGN